MQRVIPALRVQSFELSRDFYQRLGFEVQWQHQFEPGFPVFASLGYDGMEIYLTEHTGDCQFGGLIHFDVPDVDEYCRIIVGRGIEVAQPPTNSMGPDLRDMLIVDPDGNRLAFLTRQVTPAGAP
jgi:catechol 2,3-dioxygenase-like lactoylglutathione lyase family enzyme